MGGRPFGIRINASSLRRNSPMISKRIGHWSWSLSADERRTAAAAASRQRQQTSLAARLQRKHAAMVEKQQKLDDRERQLDQQGVIRLGGAGFRRPNAGNAAGKP